ncbi:MAG TPA: SHOCT domain-containing protein [Acidimicrobiales bacterium]|nr:SHOCT domain-containing protein [Acidimicrobiales bacterium]
MVAFSIWEAIWLIFVTFVFVSVLMMLFSVIVDLFRNRDMSGGMKAVWVLFLLILPLLSMLVYLIANGKGMAERSMAQHAEAEADVRQYIRQTAGTSPADDIAQAKSLLDAGTIDQAEFDILKTKALS